MIETPKYTYYIKKSSEPEGSYRTPEGASEITDNYYTFTGLEDGVNYDIRVTVNGDVAGNIGTGYLDNRTTEYSTRRRYRRSNNIWKCNMEWRQSKRNRVNHKYRIYNRVSSK